MHQGWSGSPSPDDVTEHLKSAYVRHNQYIRDNVPAERLLDFKLSDGWGPLCEFLGKEVPDVPFPHLNDSAEYAVRGKRLGKKMIKRALRNILCPCFR
jgi:hypothetical protein